MSSILPLIDPFLCDCNGREILVGDVLKISHFVGQRRKRYYMYKQVIERIDPFILNQARVAEVKTSYLRISHLERTNHSSYYLERMDGRKLDDYEIVQGYNLDGSPFDERPKRL